MYTRLITSLLLLVLTAALAACGGGSDVTTPAAVAPTFTISATVTGLASGQSIILLINGGNSLPITSNNQLTAFTSAITYNGSYVVTVGTQPTGQTCSVTSGSGTGITSNVTNVTVACSSHTYTIGGVVTGLDSGQQISLLNSGGNPKVVIGSGTGSDSFVFSSPVAYLGSYSVTVGNQPANETCSISGGTGSGYGINANINSVALTCSVNSYHISGSVAGLATGQQVTLFNNGGNATTVVGGGSGTDAFTFSTPIAYLGSYLVTINQQPNNEVCTVATNPSGTNNVSANVTNVGITCSLDSYTVGGTVFQLFQAATITLLNNSANPTSVSGEGSGNDAFTFSTPVAYQGSYTVSIGNQPIGEVCSLALNSGYASNNVSNVVVTCDDPSLICYNDGVKQFTPIGFNCQCQICFGGRTCDQFICEG